MPEYLKTKFYKIVVRPVTVYGAESHPVARKRERALHIMKIKILGLLDWLDLAVENEHVLQRPGA